MSSSQTMTAPAVGHRPPDAAPDMSSVYDYSRSQQQQHLDPQPHPSPPNDSAIRALHDPAPDSLDPSSPNGLPALSSTMVKAEPDDQTSISPAPQDTQSDLRRQSAASALLAQLLGNQSSSGPSPSEDHPMPPAPQETDQPQQIDDKSNLQWSMDSTSEPPAVAPTDSTGGGADQIPPTSTDLSLSHHHQEENFEHQTDLSSAHHEQESNPAINTNDPIDGLTDPLLFSKTGIDHADLFNPFDVSSSSKNPFDALQHSEMLTDAYLSQNADLSALAYPGLPQDGSGSVDGSEPRIQAFAKLEFDDGHFYCNTYSFILGRDVRAARAAHQREIQVRQAMRTSRAKSSSGGNMSHTPVRVKHEGSGIMGSVVSDRGGIMGFDPDVSHLPPRLSRRSSVSSHAESGAPLHATPAQLQSTDNNTTDYNALAMQSLNEENGDAKPVDALALLPSPDACPTIPIHPPATVDGSAAGHRGISRKHVKIAYNFDKNLFEMEVMGRNGAFIGADWLSPGQVRPLHSGDYIQIGGVRIRFLLPDVPIGETGADRVEEPFGAGEENSQTPASVENEAEAQKLASDTTENKDAPRPTKLVLKTRESDPARPMPSVEGAIDPSLQPIRRRGPGRPPKDGIMSKRERAELAREQKLAAKREANGGVTPPPANRAKAGKAPASTTATVTPKEMGGESPGSKPEKRKYTKRKKPDGTPMDFPLPSTEGGQFPMEHRPEDFIKAPPVKKRKPSRSPSPNYPPESAYTPEDLAKPPYNYAVLIFDALTEAGTPMTLKQIYRALKLKYPYFRFKCETEGWTSSVRHNLNGNSHLFMHAERDGKGWSWQLRPGASVEKEKKRRPSPPPPAAQPPPPAAPPQYMPALNPSYGTQPNGQPSMANPHFQFPAMPSNPYATHPPAPAPSPAPPTPHHASPYPPPSQPAASTPFPIPSPLRNNLPPAFAQTTPSTYTSPYASDPPPQLVQLQQAQQSQPMPPQPQHQSPYPPPNPPPMPPTNAPHPTHQTHAPPPPPPGHHPPGPPPGPPMQHQPNMGVGPGPGPGPGPMDNSDASSFNDRANKAIDDFEAVLMEDYEDKNYIREVLKSARARVLGNATDSSFPGGEPKDEEVIVDALRNLIGSLKGE
ncbi:forkhead domain protein [Aspergillus homomorphus CBS 101889]|uniref:Forkhead domain protein n=1 Tax=Aspergillus homomorphus (strain CBS 101889) TaxID=1450537 RepID=A0A395HU40_ASPHC|nr:hypothetical protein BO97DRAFT_371883 [Aspergillus homomorphus CBS 101889]RAL10905.1 hypothetical protein BO97DRAFT_371883 [Aspergillus homomorphus CBS 101889]